MLLSGVLLQYCYIIMMISLNGGQTLTFLCDPLHSLQNSGYRRGMVYNEQHSSMKPELQNHTKSCHTCYTYQLLAENRMYYIGRLFLPVHDMIKSWWQFDGRFIKTWPCWRRDFTHQILYRFLVWYPQATYQGQCYLYCLFYNLKSKHSITISMQGIMSP